MLRGSLGQFHRKAAQRQGPVPEGSCCCPGSRMLSRLRLSCCNSFRKRTSSCETTGGCNRLPSRDICGWWLTRGFSRGASANHEHRDRLREAATVSLRSVESLVACSCNSERHRRSPPREVPTLGGMLRLSRRGGAPSQGMPAEILPVRRPDHALPTSL